MKKRRGAVCGSVTRLGSRVKELEATAGEPDTPDHARQLVTRLEKLDSEFKSHHYQLIDLIDFADEEALEQEQEVLDQFDDSVTALTVALQQLISTSSSSPSTSINRKTLSRKLSHLEKKLKSAEKTLSEEHDDVSFIAQHQEQLADYKRELGAIYEDLLILNIEDSDDLIVLHSRLEELQFNCSHKVKKLLSSCTPDTASAPVADGKGVKLPKLDVPTFDGDILNWKQF